MQKVTPCLWFDGKAEEATHFYCSVFKDSGIVSITHFSEAGAKASGMPEGMVMTVVFHINGQEFMALNGGPQFKFSPAVSFIANCDTQEEIDRLWENLSAGGEEGVCGWITDRFGVSWQIVPSILTQMMLDPEKSNQVMSALLQMKKLDIKALTRAYEH